MFFKVFSTMINALCIRANSASTYSTPMLVQSKVLFWRHRLLLLFTGSCDYAVSSWFSESYIRQINGCVPIGSNSSLILQRDCCCIICFWDKYRDLLDTLRERMTVGYSSPWNIQTNDWVHFIFGFVWVNPRFIITDDAVHVFRVSSVERCGIQPETNFFTRNSLSNLFLIEFFEIPNDASISRYVTSRSSLMSIGHSIDVFLGAIVDWCGASLPKTDIEIIFF